MITNLRGVSPPNYAQSQVEYGQTVASLPIDSPELAGSIQRVRANSTTSATTSTTDLPPPYQQSSHVLANLALGNHNLASAVTDDGLELQEIPMVSSELGNPPAYDDIQATVAEPPTTDANEQITIDVTSENVPVLHPDEIGEMSNTEQHFTINLRLGNQNNDRQIIDLTNLNPRELAENGINIGIHDQRPQTQGMSCASKIAIGFAGLAATAAILTAGAAATGAFAHQAAISPKGCKSFSEHSVLAMFCENLLGNYKAPRIAECESEKWNCEKKIQHQNSLEANCKAEIKQQAEILAKRLQKCHQHAEWFNLQVPEIIEMKFQQALRENRLPILMQSDKADMSGGNTSGNRMVSSKGLPLNNQAAKNGFFQMSTYCESQNTTADDYGKFVEKCPSLEKFETNMQSEEKFQVYASNENCTISMRPKEISKQMIKEHREWKAKEEKAFKNYNQASSKYWDALRNHYKEKKDNRKIPFVGTILKGWDELSYSFRRQFGSHDGVILNRDLFPALHDAQAKARSELWKIKNQLNAHPNSPCYGENTTYSGIVFHKDLSNQAPVILRANKTGNLLMASAKRPQAAPYGAIGSDYHLTVLDGPMSFAKYLDELSVFITNMVSNCQSEEKSSTSSTGQIIKNAQVLIKAFSSNYLHKNHLAIPLTLAVKTTINGLVPNIFPEVMPDMPSTHSVTASTFEPTTEFSIKPPPEEEGRYDWEQYGAYSTAGLFGVGLAFLGGWYMGKNDMQSKIRRNCTDEEYRRIFEDDARPQAQQASSSPDTTVEENIELQEIIVAPTNTSLNEQLPENSEWVPGHTEHLDGSVFAEALRHPEAYFGESTPLPAEEEDDLSQLGAAAPPSSEQCLRLKKQRGDSTTDSEDSDASICSNQRRWRRLEKQREQLRIKALDLQYDSDESDASTDSYEKWRRQEQQQRFLLNTNEQHSSWEDADPINNGASQPIFRADLEQQQGRGRARRTADNKSKARLNFF